ncbi:hypothetical protein OG884_05810 [Streptosporangium sp. NBC_01755]|uniref:hypothetical protein n=1 Tax=Streptosporangium sp. NBC_01755 TaxID=2975949 RepID=UPI002DD8E687|nr:hypothetical protein [Streptosporangium sp. NBC_01755]WSD01441.1 hypothetical protein OG884_05810 [Streptosporangium sp. NBC_01755]
MAREKDEHPRWGDDALSGRVTHVPSTYDYQAAGPVRRAVLNTPGGNPLGHVWTDDLKAAGFEPAEVAGAAGRKAGSAVWAIHRDAYRDKTPASDLLNPELYKAVGKLQEPTTEQPDA